jgi:hypothetical protein
MFGVWPMIAGLCAGGGLGLLVLYGEEKEKKNVLRISLLHFGISVLAGLVIQYLFKNFLLEHIQKFTNSLVYTQKIYLWVAHYLCYCKIIER